MSEQHANKTDKIIAPKVKGAILSKVIEFCKKYEEDPSWVQMCKQLFKSY